MTGVQTCALPISRYVNLAAVGLLALLATAGVPFVQELLPALASVGYTGWFLWLFLILSLIGVEHPPALDDVTTLDPRRRLVGIAVIVLFVLLFVPVPLRMV